MNTTIMLTYYYDEPSLADDTENHTTTVSLPSPSINNISHAHNNFSNMAQIHHKLSSLDHAVNPALVHHLYLGLNHMGKVQIKVITRLYSGEVCG